MNGLKLILRGVSGLIMGWCMVSANMVRAEAAAPQGLDLTFEKAGSAKLFTAGKGSVEQGNGTLIYTFKRGSALHSPSLAGSVKQLYNPTLENRNTMMFLLENRSPARKLRLRFITEADTVYDDAKSKVFDIEPNAPRRACYFNLSDNPHAKGRLIGFRLEPLAGEGTWEIDRITFEQEKVIRPMAGRITACTAVDSTITVTGVVLPAYAKRYHKIRVYETSMQLTQEDPQQMTLICEGPLNKTFKVSGIPLYHGTMTRLSSQFAAFAVDPQGHMLQVAPRFYIENWQDFEDNPYVFTLPCRTLRATRFGAKGDGFTDDTDAIQAAIDSVAALGGGRVTLEGDSSFYGRRYVATHLMMKNNVELNIGQGAILWQSQNPQDYKYKPAYGHEGSIPGVNWTHNMHVANLPLIQGKSISRIKITGPGEIRMMDPESQDSSYQDYQRYCTDRIHLVPIGLWDVKDVEVSDLGILRSNNYHTAFYGCKNIFIGNLKMHEVQCVSGDGIGLGGTQNVKVVRSFLESNDDGVVLWVGYNDPRGVLWWWPRPQADNSVRDVTVCHSYINSACKGGGKAIAFIPWGTDNPNWEHSEIDNITVYDCVLKGGYSVGTWPDNPYFGKQPFDNTETDDYSPVKNVRIYNNLYLSPCDLLCIEPTNFISDCGIHSSKHFQNGKFDHGHAYWTLSGKAYVEQGIGHTSGGRLYQGLYLTAGEHQFTAQVSGQGWMFVEHAGNGTIIERVKIGSEVWAPVTIRIKVDADDTYFLGVDGEEVHIHEASLK